MTTIASTHHHEDDDDDHHDQAYKRDRNAGRCALGVQTVLQPSRVQIMNTRHRYVVVPTIPLTRHRHHHYTTREAGTTTTQ